MQVLGAESPSWAASNPDPDGLYTTSRVVPVVEITVEILLPCIRSLLYFPDGNEADEAEEFSEARRVSIFFVSPIISQ